MFKERWRAALACSIFPVFVASFIFSNQLDETVSSVGVACLQSDFFLCGGGVGREMWSRGCSIWSGHVRIVTGENTSTAGLGCDGFGLVTAVSVVPTKSWGDFVSGGGGGDDDFFTFEPFPRSPSRTSEFRAY